MYRISLICGVRILFRFVGSLRVSVRTSTKKSFPAPMIAPGESFYNGCYRDGHSSDTIIYEPIAVPIICTNNKQWNKKARTINSRSRSVRQYREKCETEKQVNHPEW